MRKPKLIEDYSSLLVDAVSPFGHSVVRQTAASAFIADGDKLSKDLDLALEAYDTAVAAVDYPSPAQTAQRDQLRQAVTAQLNRLAKRLNLDYPANEPALLSAGLTLAATTGTGASQSLAPATALMEFELLDGGTPGCLLLRFSRPPGTVQNLIRFTTDNTLPESQWEVAVGGGREREIGPFPSGTRVWVKVAALTGSTTAPQYSAIKTRLVQ
ncbi:hypothetical protein [Hymenobacter ruricola]|uniref:Uncharacterized protein n=1 Tax=Hymenobacter ruricola TaxID=2791023 RepID=A0ABS0I9I4_9BACT|nr:hypothetical protein [Hymenobacter ruricola]MBF9223169.1 hypothetical protein [Hymenobacter ruricola]